jgi:hypothetical protein
LKTLLQLLVETLLDNSGKVPEYLTLAKRSAAIALQEVKVKSIGVWLRAELSRLLPDHWKFTSVDTSMKLVISLLG